MVPPASRRPAKLTVESVVAVTTNYQTANVELLTELRHPMGFAIKNVMPIKMLWERDSSVGKFSSSQAGGSRFESRWGFDSGRPMHE